MISIVIVTHGEFGAYLLEAAEEIVGRSSDQCVCVATISRKLSLVEARQKIEAALKNAREFSGSEGLLVLCDMLGGTPCNETLMLTRHHSNVEILAGINLYMLVSALMNARRLSVSALAHKVMEDARRSVANGRELFLSKQKT